MRRAQPPHPGRASAKPSGPARNAVQSKWFRSPLRCGRARRNCATSHPATRVPSAVLSRGGLIRHDFSDRATTNAGLPANRRATASRSADTPSCAATALILSPRIQPSRPQSTISSKLRVALPKVKLGDHGVRAEGLEPSNSFEHRHLKPACLPISSRPRRSDRTASTPGQPGSGRRDPGSRMYGMPNLSSEPSGKLGPQ